MPVTAKLSRKFYEQLGDDIANELVDWLNNVDDSFRNELRELNELNFARFDANMKQGLAELRAENADMKVDLHRTISDQKSEIMRWMFGLWATQMFALVGVILAMVLRGP
jgi:hypothetical protein